MALQHAESGEAVDLHPLGRGPAEERPHATVDVVDRISQFQAPAAPRRCLGDDPEVIRYRPGDTFREVWGLMKAQRLKRAPGADRHGHPLGILSARQLMQALLEETKQEEELLRDYVMGMGYR